MCRCLVLLVWQLTQCACVTRPCVVQAALGPDFEWAKGNVPFIDIDTDGNQKLAPPAQKQWQSNLPAACAVRVGMRWRGQAD